MEIMKSAPIQYPSERSQDLHLIQLHMIFLEALDEKYTHLLCNGDILEVDAMSTVRRGGCYGATTSMSCQASQLEGNEIGVAQLGQEVSQFVATPECSLEVALLMGNADRNESLSSKEGQNTQ